MSYAGFDTFGYPGDSVMDWLKRNTNFCWTGFYLAPAPSHPNTSWMSHRQRLVDTGWGIAPLYVGQETIGPGRHNVTGIQGHFDGADAAKLMEQAGFPKGSVVYIDLENGPPFTVAEQNYVTSWVAAVEASGYKAGVYASFLFSAAVHKVVPSAYIWTFHVKTVNLHRVHGPTYPDSHPALSGYGGATLWQLDQSAQIDVPNGHMLVDLDTSAWPDPSTPPSVTVGRPPLSAFTDPPQNVGSAVPNDTQSLASFYPGA